MKQISSRVIQSNEIASPELQIWLYEIGSTFVFWFSVFCSHDYSFVIADRMWSNLLWSMRCSRNHRLDRPGSANVLGEPLF